MSQEDVPGDAPRKCPQEMPHGDVPRKCPKEMSAGNAPRRCPEEMPAEMSRENLSGRCFRELFQGMMSPPLPAMAGCILYPVGQTGRARLC